MTYKYLMGSGVLCPIYVCIYIYMLYAPCMEYIYLHFFAQIYGKCKSVNKSSIAMGVHLGICVCRLCRVLLAMAPLITNDVTSKDHLCRPGENDYV